MKKFNVKSWAGGAVMLCFMCAGALSWCYAFPLSGTHKQQPQQQQPVKYKAELTLQEWQVVFTGLLELPGKVGNPVINQLQVQLQAQDNKGTAASVVPPADKKKDTTTTKSQTTGKKP